jgi:hypothetical protein
MEKNLIAQWNPYIKKSVRVSKTDIKPRNIYKIQTYRYSDGVVRRKLGVETNLLFVIGIHLYEIHAIRLNSIQFTHFTNWSTRFAKKDLTDIILDSVESISFKDLIVEFNDNGREFFTKYVRNSPTIYSEKLDPYRTYKMKNIIYAQEILLDSTKMKNIYG